MNAAGNSSGASAPTARATTRSARPIDIAASRLQRIALVAIREAGGRGLTTHELATRVNIHRDTMQPRTSELRKRGLIRDSGGRRQNFSGKFAIVWIAGGVA